MLPRRCGEIADSEPIVNPIYAESDFSLLTVFVQAQTELDTQPACSGVVHFCPDFLFSLFF
jgi:hypothetical protein